mmetsp:Transcript_16474/g.29579  ORF Transcript_16474/g.29579 Transcript_16474/m.29579 type:complete len:304 (-) Transcript_16474:48-959(-)
MLQVALKLESHFAEQRMHTCHHGRNPTIREVQFTHFTSRRRDEALSLRLRLRLSVSLYVRQRCGCIFNRYRTGIRHCSSSSIIDNTHRFISLDVKPGFFVTWSMHVFREIIATTYAFPLWLRLRLRLRQLRLRPWRYLLAHITPSGSKASLQALHLRNLVLELRDSTGDDAVDDSLVLEPEHLSRRFVLSTAYRGTISRILRTRLVTDIASCSSILLCVRSFIANPSSASAARACGSKKLACILQDTLMGHRSENRVYQTPLLPVAVVLTTRMSPKLSLYAPQCGAEGLLETGHCETRPSQVV